MSGLQAMPVRFTPTARDGLGTFIGALCFLVAVLLGLPRFREPDPALRQFAA